MPPCRITIIPEARMHTISPYIYSHFAEHLGRCIYEGIWVGDHPKIPNDNGIREDTAQALRHLSLPAIRWPGGCFADNYHWQDGIGPSSERPKRHNLWWNQPETNKFGTDEFIRFCRKVNTEPYICLNVGSGTVEEARSWVEYCNSSQDTYLTNLRRKNGSADPYNVKFWGIGNENWGCGGCMRPEHYADLYRQFAVYVRNTAGPESKLFACGSHPGINDWDARFLSYLVDYNQLFLLDVLALHIYSGGGKSDLQFNDDDYYLLISQIDIMESNLRRAIGLADAYSTLGHKIRIALDEWGTWWREATTEKGLYQQNTLQDAIFTALSFNLFNSLGETLYMTNMAQTINVLQALLLTKGPEMVRTPTYHIYDMYQPHRNGSSVYATVEAPMIKCPDQKEKPVVSLSASVNPKDNSLFLTLVNIDLSNHQIVQLGLDSRRNWCFKEGQILTSPDIHDHNTFGKSEKVKPSKFKVAGTDNAFRLKLPPKSVVTLKFV